MVVIITLDSLLEILSIGWVGLVYINDFTINNQNETVMLAEYPIWNYTP